MNKARSIIKRFSLLLEKIQDYLILPWLFPKKFIQLYKDILTNRVLVRELVHLEEHYSWFETWRFATIIDVGAYIGAFAYAMDVIQPGVKIISFEPLPDNFDKLNKNMKNKNHFSAYNLAVGDSAGEVTFHRSEFSPSSSILPMENLHKETFPKTANTRMIKVPMVRLDDLVEEMRIISPCLLKIDVQGYEMGVLRGACSLLNHVDCIISEVSHQPLYEGQATFDEIYGYLIDKGFSFAGCLESLISPRDGSILQSDAVFIRKADR